MRLRNYFANRWDFDMWCHAVACHNFQPHHEREKVPYELNKYAKWKFKVVQKQGNKKKRTEALNHSLFAAKYAYKRKPERVPRKINTRVHMYIGLPIGMYKTYFRLKSIIIISLSEADPLQRQQEPFKQRNANLYREEMA